MLPEIHCIRLSEQLEVESQHLDTLDIGDLVRQLADATAKAQCRLRWAVNKNSALRGPRACPVEKLVPAKGMTLISIIDEEEHPNA